MPSRTHPLRAYAHGDLSHNIRGRSGDHEVGAYLSHVDDKGLGICISRDVDGLVRVTLSTAIAGERITLLEPNVNEGTPRTIDSPAVLDGSASRTSPNHPQPGQTLNGGRVVASVVYCDCEPRYEVLVLRLLPEPPFYEVGTWDCRTAVPVPMGDDVRFFNIVEATDHYQDCGGDI
jgi:hypothetical protein